MTAAAQHEDGDGTTFDDGPNGNRVAGVVRFYGIGPKFGRHSGVQVQPFRLARILHGLAPSQGLDDQRYADALTFSSNFGGAGDLFALEIGVAGAHYQVGQHGVRAVTQSVFRTDRKSTRLNSSHT